MSIILVTILAMSTTPNQPTQETVAPAVQATTPAAKRSGRELSDAAHAAMRHWAKATDQEADAAARELLGIYGEIQQDTCMARSQRETLRLTVRARLDQLCAQISKRVTRDKGAAKADAAVKSVAASDHKPGNVALAQIGLPAGGGAGFGGGAAGGQDANADNGQQLVDMIQNVISPKSWDINGGGCSIYYWQQQRAIVVRATDDVHGEISDTLEQLNRANH
jgi:hypothetical protein